MTDTRFIEESFPVKEVGEISAKEKNIRHGHISTLHIWWARRPLAASRATAYAALTPAPQNIEEWQKKRDFIIELSKWENSLNETLLRKARQDILDANGGVQPRVLDLFAGGGSYPLETLRLGCESYANDYNPVAVLILKATLEYPQKFGKLVEIEEPGKDELFTRKRTVNPLLEAVKKWGNSVMEEVRQELTKFYPTEPDGAVPLGYIWARTIPCQNPDCGLRIPLMRQFWLAKRKGKKVALHIEPIKRELQFNLVGDGYADWPLDFDAGKGTIDKGIATCPVCSSTIDGKTIRRLFKEKKDAQRMVAVVLSYPKKLGKLYRVATPHDEQVYQDAESKLVEKREKLMLEWGLDPVPDEPIPPLRPSPNARGVSGITRYEMKTWGDLFNSRQKLALITIIEKIRHLHQQQINLNTEEQQFADAVATYLAFSVDKLTDYLSVLTTWVAGGEFWGHTWARQALSMVWDYIEINSLEIWMSSLGWIYRVLEHLTSIQNSALPIVTQSSATDLPYEENVFDAVLTDPPYYDNVPYSNIADYFYVWLKRSVGHIYFDLFSTPLTPKTNEIVAYALPEGGFEAGKEFFESKLKTAFQEINRILKPNGIVTIVYAHKSNEGWETLINSLLDSDLVMTGAWPVNSERQVRLVAKETAALASSIYIVARKMERQPTGFYNDVREELRQHLNRKLHRLWEEGISGADFFIAAIGSAIEVFGKYERVMDFEGNIVRADRLLNDVQTIATDYAVHQILRNGFSGEVTELTRFYVLWRWNYGDARVSFDEARKLAQSCGIDLSREWKRTGSFIKQQKDMVRVLGPQNRKVEDLEDANELIDTLHRVLLLWEKGKRDTMIDTLARSIYGRSEAFYRVAQAISETLPNESKEKKLLDGFLVGRERLQNDIEFIPQQKKLFD